MPWFFYALAALGLAAGLAALNHPGHPGWPRRSE